MIKRLSSCIREYKKQTILTPVCMVGEVVCECTIPLLTADLINSAICARSCFTASSCS